MSMYNYKKRCEKTQKIMKEENVDYLFLSISSDLLYLTGYQSRLTSRLTLFVLPQIGTPKMIIPELESFKLDKNNIFYDIIPWGENTDPIKYLSNIITLKKTKIGISDHIWGKFLLEIQKALPESRFIYSSKILSSLRKIKDHDEISDLREMGYRMDKVFEDVCKLKFSGFTEMELGYEVFDIVRRHGLNPTFAGGVSSGKNSSSPHHSSNDRKMEVGDVVWIELGQGGHYNNYKTDKTRVFVVQKLPEGFEKVYNIVKQAHEAAFDSIYPGISCEMVDRAGRKIIEKNGYGKYFIHRLGHGLGLDLHEEPYIVEGNKEKLQEGMVFSDEPGIYLPNEFGIRIEDILVVTKDGAESLYTSTHDYVIVE